MMGRSHLIISTGVTLSLLELANQEINLPIVAVVTVSSLLPDIDEPNSLLVRRSIPPFILRIMRILLIGVAVFVHILGSGFTPWNTIVACMIGVVSFISARSMRNQVILLIGIALLLFGQTHLWSGIAGSALIVCSLAPHRGITHSIYGVIGWAAILSLLPNTYSPSLWLGGGLSYLTHLLCDMITNHGIRPLPPFNIRFRLNLMGTGTLRGSVVEKICIGLTFLLVWFAFLREINWNTLF